MEIVFRFAQEKKRGEDTDEWSGNMRAAVRELRRAMADNLRMTKPSAIVRGIEEYEII